MRKEEEEERRGQEGVRCSPNATIVSTTSARGVEIPVHVSVSTCGESRRKGMHTPSIGTRPCSGRRG